MSMPSRPTSLIFISPCYIIPSSLHVRHLANRPLNWYISCNSLNKRHASNLRPLHVLCHRATTGIYFAKILLKCDCNPTQIYKACSELQNVLTTRKQAFRKIPKERFVAFVKFLQGHNSLRNSSLGSLFTNLAGMHFWCHQFQKPLFSVEYFAKFA